MDGTGTLVQSQKALTIEVDGWDGSGLSASKTMFIGIDKTTMTTPTVGDGGEWSDNTEITISGFDSATDDGSGSGLDCPNPAEGTWSNITTSSTTLTFLKVNIRF